MTAKECITGRRSIRQYTAPDRRDSFLCSQLEAYANRSLYRCGRRKESETRRMYFLLPG